MKYSKRMSTGVRKPIVMKRRAMSTGKHRSLRKPLSKPRKSFPRMSTGCFYNKCVIWFITTCSCVQWAPRFSCSSGGPWASGESFQSLPSAPCSKTLHTLAHLGALWTIPGWNSRSSFLAPGWCPCFSTHSSALLLANSSYLAPLAIRVQSSLLLFSSSSSYTSTETWRSSPQNRPTASASKGTPPSVKGYPPLLT